MPYTGSGPVVTIDCRYRGLERAAAYLMIEGDRAAFVDNNTVHALPHLLAALAAHGLEPAQVKYLIVTHVHLDHAGGTAALLARCKKAKVLCHPRAARHLIDPHRLVQGAIHIYGQEAFERLYGTVDPVPEKRIRTVEDGQRLRFGKRTLHFMHTPGHARHHLCLLDSASKGILAGDSFGLYYPSIQRGDKPYITYSSPPTDFDPNAARATVRRIVDARPERVYLTHFGTVTDVPAAAEVLLPSIDDLEAIANDGKHSELEDNALLEMLRGRVYDSAVRQFDTCGIVPTAADLALVDHDVLMNARGLMHYVEKARQKAAGG
jgi:glyoxylase-like metal-dependent hydrolase (beta-lactamase superfamily II)